METAAIASIENNGYSEQDLEDIKFTPRVDDALDNTTTAE